MNRIPLQILLAILSLVTLGSGHWLNAPDPDEHLTVLELISTKGYPAEEHHVPTDDGYILTMHRIRGSRYEKVRGDTVKPVVFLQHGLLDCSATWVVNSPDESLGFILADQGFDVWMGNVRGNTFGMGHKYLKPDDPKFWDFSWDEMAKHDLPSMVYYALNHTKQTDLFYVGHSQGTMIAFSGLSMNEELAARIKLFVALGPVATVASIVSPIKYLSDVGTNPDHELIFDLVGRKGFLPSSQFIKWLSDLACTNQVTTPLICDNIIFLFTGPSENLNNSRVSVYTNHAPAGTSVKNFVHYAQSVNSKSFQMYDYGVKNMERYNQTSAPLYNITNVKVPVALYYADKDWLADPRDVEFIRSRVDNIVDDYNCKGWNHLDFLWAENANTLLYGRLVKLIQKYL